MGSRFYIRNFILFGLLANSQLQIPVGEMEYNLDMEISGLFHILTDVQKYFGIHSIITYRGKVDLNPSLEQLLMDRFSLPLYTIRPDEGPLNRSYNHSGVLIIVFFTGLDDPIMEAINDANLRKNLRFIAFIYASPRNEKKHFTTEVIREFFEWCWDRSIDKTVLIVRDKTNIDMWSYYYLGKIYVLRFGVVHSFLEALRKIRFNLTVQVVNDPPFVFWYNSSDQADLTGSNVSLSGSIGLMIVEFTRYLNATINIIPIPGQQTARYEIFQMPGNQTPDIVANVVDDNSIRAFSPMVAESQICLAVPNRRMIPPYRYIDKILSPGMYPALLLSSLGVFLIKYFSQRRRSFLDPIFNTIRFHLAIPLPGGQLHRLPLADKLVEVFSFFFLGLLISASVSVMSTTMTTGIWEPPITNVETMRASGLRIMTDDPTIPQAFMYDVMPRSLADLVFVVDTETMFHHITCLNSSYAYVIRTPNWGAFRLYQQRMKREFFQIAGKELCSSMRPIRVPLSPKSALRFFFIDYYRTVFKSGLIHKWVQMGFNKFREIKNLKKLPIETDEYFRPLSIDFFWVFICIYIGGMFVSILVFFMELLVHRYWR
ncbi:uncharacterized protein LOC108042235 [Drosophila rhopaloa]|uniref:Uncharacterized protein LOC108042235 n=1 Tax=Drosophila rhopaloa TaxID=1041015 RepID=A0A6P4ERT1_DRORH|nr:uncharacterized protein LOC108042235 [Drosophila rhopaloa]